MLLVSVIKSDSLLLVQWCLFLSSLSVMWPHGKRTAYLLDLSYYHLLVVIVTYFLFVSPCSNVAHCSVQLTQLFFCQFLYFYDLLGHLFLLYLILSSVVWRHASTAQFLLGNHQSKFLVFGSQQISIVQSKRFCLEFQQPMFMF